MNFTCNFLTQEKKRMGETAAEEEEVK